MPTQTQDSVIETIKEVFKYIWDNKDLIGRLYAEATGGVTNVKKWVNETDVPIEYWKYDKSGMQPEDVFSLPAKSTKNKDSWIPWADNAQQYSGGKRAVIWTGPKPPNPGGKPLAYIWQNGPRVRFNTSDQWVQDGPEVAGVSNAGGERTVVIAKDPAGNIGFAFMPLKVNG